MCNKCNTQKYKQQKKDATHETALAAPPLRRCASAPPRLRTLQPLAALSRSGQRSRKRKADELLQQLQVPAAALSTPRIPPPLLLRTSTRFRAEMRRVLPAVHIPGEKAIAAEKERAALEKGTATAVFNTVASQSTHVVIGADCGSSFTKIGITYIHKDTTHFAPILIYEGKDDWAQLSRFLSPAAPPF